MTNNPSLGLIINTWQQPDYLGRVLRAVSGQACPPKEVLLADDGSEDETRRVFESWAKTQSFAVTHVWQKHEGFRRARILNQAIAKATSDYLVFLDGDTVPHPQFVPDHLSVARAGKFVQGHRALVRQRASAWFGTCNFYAERRRALWQGQLQGWKHVYRWPRPLARARTDLRGVRGCNLAIWREHLVQINGYNEAFIGWGREDSELAVRLMNSGVQRLDLRGWALCYHLWHPPADRAALPVNDQLLAEARDAAASRCESGLDRYSVART